MIESSNSSSRISVLHLITTLDVGGAEMMLAKLLASINSEKFANYVISLTNVGSVGKSIKKAGIPTYALHMPDGRVTAKGLKKMWCLIRWIRPTILQTWLYHADLLGVLFGKLASIPHVCWNIRCSYIDLSQYRFTTKWVLKLCSLLSRLPSCIVSNSRAAVKFHKKLGYNGKRWQVIPNGFDLNIYKPDDTAKTYLFQELLKNERLTDNQKPNLKQVSHGEREIMIGYVARFDPMKDHLNFIEAAKILLSSKINVRFVLIGRDITWQNAFFTNHIPLDLRKYFDLLGERNDLSQITPAFDMATSASYGEGFPNVICEAMACGVPCVVTNVGDCAEIVGKTGIVVKPRHPQDLAQGWFSMIEIGKEERKKLGAEARKRVMKNFELSGITKDYEELYTSLAQTP